MKFECLEIIPCDDLIESIFGFKVRRVCSVITFETNLNFQNIFDVFLLVFLTFGQFKYDVFWGVKHFYKRVNWLFKYFDVKNTIRRSIIFALCTTWRKSRTYGVPRHRKSALLRHRSKDDSAKRSESVHEDQSPNADRVGQTSERKCSFSRQCLKISLNPVLKNIVVLGLNKLYVCWKMGAGLVSGLA